MMNASELLCRASAEERRLSLPGDELVPHPKGVITHAITINIPPEALWPWVIQMASGRAGRYAYDHIDNGGVPSARRIVPELQNVEVGNVMPWLSGARDGFIVNEVVPNRALVLVVPLQPATAGSPVPTALRASWALVLEPVDQNRTRLIARSRMFEDWLAPRGAPATSPGEQKFFIECIYSLLAKMP